MTVANTGLADVWPIAAIAGAATISVPASHPRGPAPAADGFFWFRCPNSVRLKRTRSAPLQFAVGLKLKSKAEHVMVDAEDALIASLKVKAERPEALIMYVRRQN